MKRFDWRCLALSSLLLAAIGANCETRPQYGGTLRVEVRKALTSLDPADGGADSFARRNIESLMFETLVTCGDDAHAHAALATAWQISPAKLSPGNQRGRFTLRRGVKFHDGTPLTAEVAAAALRAANPSWNVSVDGDSIVIQQETGEAGVSPLLAELALPRNAIAKRHPDSQPVGTGPFRVQDWQPGKKLTLAAQEDYWRGRPFLDGIEFEMAKTYREQMMALELGKADLVEVAAEQVHRFSLDGRRMENSAPMELLALVFSRDARTPEEKSLREALALSVDRGSIRGVLLQGVGQPAGGILPSWISGYGFVFGTDADVSRARHERDQVLRDQVRSVPTWTLGYDSSDPLARLLAERIALNAKDAGLALQPTSVATTDVRLVRIPLASADPWLALEGVAAAAGLPAGKNEGTSVEDLYATEQALLGTRRVIPLLHCPMYYAASTTLKGWNLRSDGSWNLADAWLGSGKP